TEQHGEQHDREAEAVALRGHVLVLVHLCAGRLRDVLIAHDPSSSDAGSLGAARRVRATVPILDQGGRGSEPLTVPDGGEQALEQGYAALPFELLVPLDTQDV